MHMFCNLLPLLLQLLLLRIGSGVMVALPTVTCPGCTAQAPTDFYELRASMASPGGVRSSQHRRSGVFSARKVRLHSYAIYGHASPGLGSCIDIFDRRLYGHMTTSLKNTSICSA